MKNLLEFIFWLFLDRNNYCLFCLFACLNVFRYVRLAEYLTYVLGIPKGPGCQGSEGTHQCEQYVNLRRVMITTDTAMALRSTVYTLKQPRALPGKILHPICSQV